MLPGFCIVGSSVVVVGVGEDVGVCPSVRGALGESTGVGLGDEDAEGVGE